MVLQRRSFAFTAKLSRGVPLGQADVPPGTYTGAVQLDWSQIVARMVKYCNNHFFVKSRIDDVDASTPRRHTVRHDDCTRTCILVFKILIDYLRMLRTFPLDNGGTRVMENTPTSFFQHSPSPNSRKHLKRPVFDDPRVTSLKTYDFFELSEDISPSLDKRFNGSLHDNNAYYDGLRRSISAFTMRTSRVLLQKMINQEN